MAQPKKAKPRRQKVVAGPTDEPQWWLELEELHDALDDAARVNRPDFICSISGEIMRNPALLSDGRAQGQFIYEHDHAKKWVDEHRTEPTTRAKLRDPKFALNGPLQPLAVGQFVLSHLVSHTMLAPAAVDLLD